ncbi:MAG: hypothetical protein JW702_09090 [Clostridiales bacterium]|nr:hypothetical protein [Clostridiales bacterium]
MAKRGRPRKIEIEEVIKRKRGRPRKENTPVSPVKRGRPKKQEEINRCQFIADANVIEFRCTNGLTGISDCFFRKAPGLCLHARVCSSSRTCPSKLCLYCGSIDAQKDVIRRANKALVDRGFSSAEEEGMAE